MNTSQQPLRPWPWRWVCFQAQAMQLAWHYLRSLHWKTLLMVLSMGGTLALPLAGTRALQVAQTTLNHWHQREQVLAYFYPHMRVKTQRETANRMHAHPAVSRVRWITPARGLEAIQGQLDKKLLNEFLKDNPLPTTLVITLQPQTTLRDAQALITSLEHMPGIEKVQANLAWLNQIQHMINLWEHLVTLLAVAILSLVVLLLTNTTNLLAWIHKSDAELLSMLGASQATIRRPYRMAALILGTMACLVAGALVAWMHHYLAPFFESFTDVFFHTPVNFPPWPWDVMACYLIGLLVVTGALTRH